MIIDSRIPRNRYDPRVVVRTVSSLFGSTIIFCILLLVGIDATTPASAEFNVEPYIQGGARFDTNPRYQSSRQEFDSAWGTICRCASAPRIPYAARRRSLLIPAFVYSFYPDSDDDDLEDRDNYLTGTANWLSPQSNIGASYGYTDLSLRTSEFQDAGGTPAGHRDVYSPQTSNSAGISAHTGNTSFHRRTSLR